MATERYPTGARCWPLQAGTEGWSFHSSTYCIACNFWTTWLELGANKTQTKCGPKAMIEKWRSDGLLLSSTRFQLIYWTVLTPPHPSPGMAPLLFTSGTTWAITLGTKESIPIYVCVYIYTYICVCVCVFVCVCVLVCMYVCVCLSVCVCLKMFPQ